MEFNLSHSVGTKWNIIFAVVCWHLWCYRNRCMFDKACQSTHRFWLRVLTDVEAIMSLQDQFFNTEQKISTWKPPTKPAFKINVEAFQNEDRTMAVGAAIVRDSEFQWFIGITRRIVSACMLEILLITLKEALIQAWGYHIDNLEIDLEKQLINELQAGPEGCRSYLKSVIQDIRDLLDRKWHITSTMRTELST